MKSFISSFLFTIFFVLLIIVVITFSFLAFYITKFMFKQCSKVLINDICDLLMVTTTDII